MKCKKIINRFPDYDLVTTPESGVVTFGTNLFLRKDKLAIKIVFPTGQIFTFCPEEEIKTAHSVNSLWAVFRSLKPLKELERGLQDI